MRSKAPTPLFFTSSGSLDSSALSSSELLSTSVTSKVASKSPDSSFESLSTLLTFETAEASSSFATDVFSIFGKIYLMGKKN